MPLVFTLMALEPSQVALGGAQGADVAVAAQMIINAGSTASTALLPAAHPLFKFLQN